jgi:hypothetical protein
MEQSAFQKKYDEFCTDLLGACPELSSFIQFAKNLSAEVRLKRFKEEVLPVSGNPQRNPKVCPGLVLPGVQLSDTIWSELSENSQTAIQEYLTILTMCCLMETNTNFTDLSGQAEFFTGFLNQMNERLKSADFKAVSEKFSKFIEKFASSASGEGAQNAMPKIPERFMKGKIAKLAEELVREFNAADFGLTDEDLVALERNPMRAFEVLLQGYTTNPMILQNAMKKIANRMQQKIQRGELKPQELAAEAEELLKECTDNPQFTEMMESIRTAFGFEDMDLAREQGREGSARMSIVRNRLRAKLEKKKAANQTPPSSGPKKK